MKLSNIRNFCIIAHIDHGKSTLADRFLEITGTIDKRFMKAQTLDSMELEREKGITIKLKPVRMKFTLENEEYELNLIDTPGHVDFSYDEILEVSAKTGFGIEELLAQIIKKIPSPLGGDASPLKCLIFDTVYDEYLGVVAMVRVVDGEVSEIDVKKRRQIRFISTG